MNIRGRKLLIYVTCAVAFFSITSCIQSEYDLSKGVNTEMLIGGDSLAMPIGKTENVYLSKALTNIDMLNVSADGSYSYLKKDSLTVNVDAIKPISFDITPPVIPKVEMSFTNIVLPSFHMNGFSIESQFPVPNIEINKSILPINFEKPFIYPISITTPSLISQRNIKSKSPKGIAYTINPILITANGTVDQSLSLDAYPLQLKKVDKIYLTYNWIYIKFNRSHLDSLGLTSRTENIQTFKVDFPSEYSLSSPEGDGARISGSSFIIENATLPSNVSEVVYRLKVDYIDLSSTLQSGALSYIRQIPYDFKYEIQGATDDLAKIAGKNVEIDVKIVSEPLISDLGVETNAIDIADNYGTYHLNSTITTVSRDVASISSVNFKDGAYLQIGIQDPGISPFVISAGTCEIQLPKIMRFKRTIGLDPVTNIYKIPFNQLFSDHKIYLTGAVFNQNIPDTGGDLSFNEDISYKLTGFKLSPTSVNNSQVEAMSNKKYKFTFSSSTIEIDNASLVTREIVKKIPDQITDIKINKFVSNEVLKVYSATLTSPVHCQLKLAISGMPASIDSLFFRNYTIKLPSFLKFVAGTTNSNNEIILNRGFKVSEGFIKTFDLEKLDFGADGVLLTKGSINIDEQISLIGSAYLKQTGLNLKASDLGTIEISPSITIDSLTLSIVEGKFSPTIKPYSSTIQLGMPSYLMNENVKLDVSNPVIMIKAGNTMGIPVDVALTMTPKRSGVVLTDAIINTNVSIAAATNIGLPTSSQFWLARSADGISSGYQPILVPNLVNFLKKIPDEMDVKLTPVVTGDHHKIDLMAQKNQLNVNYEVHVPLDFGADFKIAHQDTIFDIQSKLIQFITYSKKIDLLIEVENQIPLELNLDIKPLDIHKQVINGLSISTISKIKAGNADGSAQKTKQFIEVKEIELGSLAKLDGFVASVSANKNTTVAGLPLRPDQYFGVDLKVLIPKGITVDFNK